MGDSGIDTEDALDIVGLPFSIFAPGQYPVGRVNVYSRPDLLTFVYEQPRDTEDWEEIRSSSFGNLFNLPVTRCYISCKLIHSLLSRQLVTKRRYEFWSVFGSQPMRFSLSEFEAVTNLNCLPFPDNYDPESNTEPFMGNRSVWQTFIGENKNARISDLMVLPRQRKGISGWRRVGLALLLIVDGVLIANKQGDKRLTPKYVDMLGNREAFLKFPWGRESFLKTISSMIPTRLHSSMKGDSVRAMQDQLRQVSISLKGFPLALQLLAFKLIPALEERIPNSKDTRTILEVGFHAHANNAALTQNSFDDVEENTEGSVLPLVNVLRRLHSGLLWVDEVEDARVVRLEELISHGHVFESSEWIMCDNFVSNENRRRAIKGKAFNPKKVDVRGDIVGKSYFMRSRGRVVSYNEQGLCINDVSPGRDVTAQGYIDVSEKIPTKTLASCMNRNIVTEVGVQCKRQGNRGKTQVGRNNSSKAGCIDKVEQRITELMDTRIALLNEAWLKRFEKFKKKVKRSVRGGRFRCAGVSCKLSKRAIRLCKGRKTIRNDCRETIPDNLGDSVRGTDESCVPRESLGLDVELKRKSMFAGTVHSTDRSAYERTNLCGLRVFDYPEVDIEVNFRNVGDYSDEVQVPVTDIVHYRPFDGVFGFNYTPVPEVPNIPVLYSDADGVHHVAAPKRKFSEVEDVGILGGLFKKLKLKLLGIERGEEEGSCSKRNEVVVLSDSSPIRESALSVATVAEKEIAGVLNCFCIANPYPVLQKLDLCKYNALLKILVANPSRRYVTKCNFEFDNKFLLDLAKPSGWVNTLHMEILMDMLGKHHAENLAWSRAAFVSPLLVNYILSDQKRFEDMEDKSGFEWSRNIKKIVARPGAEWLEDVDLLYMPVIWGNKHWAALVINLRMSCIEVLDTYVELTREAKVQKHLAFLAKSLPYIMKQCCVIKHAASLDIKPFRVVRVPGLYQNRRSGDCGPVSAKFLEMQAYGNIHSSSSMLSDEVVDDLRRQYVLDIYGHYVVHMHLR